MTAKRAKVRNRRKRCSPRSPARLPISGVFALLALFMLFPRQRAWSQDGGEESPKLDAAGGIVVRARGERLAIPLARVFFLESNQSRVEGVESPLENPKVRVPIRLAYRAECEPAPPGALMLRLRVWHTGRSGFDESRLVEVLDLGAATPGEDANLQWDGVLDFGTYEFQLEMFPADKRTPPEISVARSRRRVVVFDPSPERRVAQAFLLDKVRVRCVTQRFKRVDREYYHFQARLDFTVRLREGRTPDDVEILLENRGRRDMAAPAALPTHMRFFDPERVQGGILDTAGQWRTAARVWPPVDGGENTAKMTWTKNLGRGFGTYGFTVAREHFPILDETDLRLTVRRLGARRNDFEWYVTSVFDCRSPEQFAKRGTRLHLPASLTRRTRRGARLVAVQEHEREER